MNTQRISKAVSKSDYLLSIWLYAIHKDNVTWRHLGELWILLLWICISTSTYYIVNIHECSLNRYFFQKYTKSISCTIVESGYLMFYKEAEGDNRYESMTIKPTNNVCPISRICKSVLPLRLDAFTLDWIWFDPKSMIFQSWFYLCIFIQL